MLTSLSSYEKTIIRRLLLHNDPALSWPLKYDSPCLASRPSE